MERLRALEPGQVAVIEKDVTVKPAITTGSLRGIQIIDKKPLGPDLYAKQEEQGRVLGEIKAGHTEAFSLLSEQLRPRLFKYIVARIRHEEEANDFVQETFTRALKGIGAYKAEDSPIEAWLFTIAHNLIVDRYRLDKRRGGKTLSLDGHERHVAVNLASHEDSVVSRMLLQELINRAELTPQQQEVIELRFFENRPSKEIALLLNKSDGAVREMQHAAFEKIRRVKQKMDLSETP